MKTIAQNQLPCNILIIGASGDLTRKKLMPALFSLFSNQMLPADFRIYGFSRTVMDDDAFRESVMEKLTCRYQAQGEKCDEYMTSFLSCCHYQAGDYHDPEAFVRLRQRLCLDGREKYNTVCYMALPSSLYTVAAESLQAAGLAQPEAAGNWLRVVLEKPFGHDGPSSRELMAQLGKVYREQQIYRIDHYLGKEVIQNLMILRFANVIFEPIWNQSCIEHVSISWSETLDCAGRGGYFDRYGIIRDVVQNHLLQILALVAMEQPIGLEPKWITDEKVKLLRCVRPFQLQQVLLGQYEGYRQEKGVADGSRTETYIRGPLAIDNPRWHGVPFYLEAGKALNRTQTEICIQFKAAPYSIFAKAGYPISANRLVIRVQPNEAIALHVVNKHPGLNFQLENAELDLLYRKTFDSVVPDAYERLLLDVLRGDHSLFLRDDELAGCWDIVDPLLAELEYKQIIPLRYAPQSSGPEDGFLR